MPPAVALAVYYFWIWFGATDAATLRVFAELMKPVFSSDGPAVAAGNVGRVAWGAGVALLIDLVLTAAGLKLFRAGTGRAEQNTLEELCLANGLGLGVGALMILFVGLAGFLRVGVVLVGLGAAAVVCIKEICHIVRFTAGAARRFLFGGGWDAAAAFKIILLLFLGVSFLAAVAPPTEPDTLWYHLTLPKLYIEGGGIVPTPHILPSHWPLNVEMLFTAAMLLGPDTAAQALNWLIGVHLLVALGCIYRQWRGTESWGGAAAVVFLSIPLVVWQFANTYSDLAVAYFKLVAVLCFFVWRKDGRISLLTVCGVLCGLAMGAKINGALGLLLVWVFLFFGGGSSTLKIKIKAALQIGVVAAVAAAPWYVRTFVWTGNPVFPFFYSVFGGSHWNELAARDYLAYLQGFLGDASLSSLAVLPYRLMFLKFQGNPYWPDTIGALLFALLIVYPACRAGRGRGLWAGIIVYFAGWFLISQQFRHLMPAFALLAVQLAAVFEGAPRRWVRVGACVVMLLQLALVGVWLSARIPAAAGPVTRGDFLNGSLQEYDAIGYINAELPSSAKVLLLWGNSGYYLDRDFVLGDPRWQGYVDYNEYRTPVELNAALRDMGITHILFISANLRGVEELDKWTRDYLNLKPHEPTAITRLLWLQNESIKREMWKPVFVSRLNRAIVFEIVE